MSRAGDVLARYNQILSLRRGSRVLDVDIELISMNHLKTIRGIHTIVFVMRGTTRPQVFFGR